MEGGIMQRFMGTSFPKSRVPSCCGGVLINSTRVCRGLFRAPLSRETPISQVAWLMTCNYEEQSQGSVSRSLFYFLLRPRSSQSSTESWGLGRAQRASMKEAAGTYPSHSPIGFHTHTNLKSTCEL